MKERLVSRVTADFFLRYAELLGRRFDGSFQRGVIFVAIVQGNISHIGHLSDESLKYADSDTTPPDNMRRPIPVNAVAASLNMPYETVRRHINALIESGYCQKVRGKGIIVPAHVLEAPENRAALKNSYDQMRRMVLLLRRAGVTFEDDK